MSTLAMLFGAFMAGALTGVFVISLCRAATIGDRQMLPHGDWPTTPPDFPGKRRPPISSPSSIVLDAARRTGS